MMQNKSGITRVSVIGLGYVGLPTAATIATRGVDVIGVDLNQKAVDTINRGESHIIETDLDVILQAAVQSGRLRAVIKTEPADVHIIAVPTPITDDKKADLRAVRGAFTSIAPVLRKGDLVILESTSPVGTTVEMSKLLAGLRSDLTFPATHPETSDVMVAYCPERILPGRTLLELVENSRTIGGLDRRSAERARELYEIFCAGELFLTNSQTAEMTKLTENAYRDVNIAFANELSMLCDDMGVNVHELIEAANRHPRVKILTPGPGVGGHCIPVDPWFIVESHPSMARLIHTARIVNDDKMDYVYDQVAEKVKAGGIAKVAMLGLAYKPDVDDLRESPALHIALRAAEEKLAEILIVEPNVEELPAAFEGKGARFVDLDTAIAEADLLVALVGHAPFARSPALAGRRDRVIDAVGLWR
jgi:UDP-N-acetyl-D-mannosaminuronic acid dehydrogenase